MIAGIRPLQLEAREAGDGGALAAQVVLLEPAGALTWVIAELDGQRLKARLAGGAQLAAGEPAGLSFAAEAAHLFDAASGRRLEP